MTTTPSHILPVLRGNYSDPTITRVGEDFYLTHSCNAYAPAFLIWHSTDLLNWRPLRPALTCYDGDIWAPDLVHHNGQFFLYYTTVGGNHVITSREIEGPWSSPIDLNLPHIDPGHLVAEDGTRYLYLSNGHIVELSPDGLFTRGEIRKVHEGWTFPSSWRTEGHCLEGPKPFHKDGFYYLVSAQGGTAGPPTSHMVTIARSESPFGPWLESPHNPLIHTESRDEQWWSRGHGTIFEDAKGQWWILYHAYENGYRTLGRHNLLEPITWTSDGWPIVDKGHSRQIEIPTNLGEHALSDDFCGPELGWQWQFYKTFSPTRFKLEENSLHLQGHGTRVADSSPMCLFPQHQAYQVDVEVEIQGDAEAGLLLFYDERCFTGLGLTPTELIMPRPSHNSMLLSHAERRAHLRIVNDHQEVELWYRLDGEMWQQLPYAYEVSGWHHNALGGFNSLRVGLYSAGTGAAIFRSFTYSPL